MTATIEQLLLGSEHAIFLPSLSRFYVQHVSRPDEAVRGGALPPALGAVRALDPLDPASPLLRCPAVLYSAGQAEPNLALAAATEAIVHGRDRGRTLVVADSGGYQLAMGTLPAAWGHAGELLDDGDDRTRKPHSLRHRILRWIEATADLGMILDWPTASVAKPRSLIHQRYRHEGPRRMVGECLRGTYHNAAYFVRHRDPSTAKLLNVLQGRTEAEQAWWWERMKEFNDRTIWDAQALDGWAFAGNLKADVPALLKRLLVMADGGYLDGAGGVMLLHFLGIARLEAAVLYTFLQRALRRHVNPKIAITYDAASPFSSATRGEGYTGWRLGPDRMALTSEDLPRKLTGAEDLTRPWPQPATALGRGLTLADLCVKAPDGEGSTWDEFSYALTMHMNLDMHLQALRAAHAAADGGGPAGAVLPRACLEFGVAVDEIVREGRAELITKHRRLLLDLLAGIVTRPSRVSLRTGFSVHGPAPGPGPASPPPEPYEEWLLDERHEDAVPPGESF